jgi:tetratricopeptide (TPR) repeat protein
LALALTNLGRIEATRGDDAAAGPPLAEATALFRSIGEGWFPARPLNSLGAIAYRAGDYEQALAAFEEALPCFRAVEDRRNTAQVLTNLGFVALAHGERERARSIFTESLAFGREHSDRFNTPACLRGIATLMLGEGNPAGAARLLAAANELFASTGAKRWPAERLGALVAMDGLRASLPEDAFVAAWEAGRTLTLSQVIDEAMAGAAAAPGMTHQ